MEEGSHSIQFGVFMVHAVQGAQRVKNLFVISINIPSGGGGEALLKLTFCKVDGENHK
jgi:hypothetical protein